MSSIPNSYDTWSIKFPAKVRVGTKIHRVLEVMENGAEMTRPDMLRAASITPNNPNNSSQDYTDYYMYKQGLLEIVAISGPSKVFKITATGLAVLAKLVSGEKAISV